tara:strand:+ start:2688 stop:3617 length:930 start_codon:yes stop_codon:yes gene_type:complete
METITSCFDCKSRDLRVDEINGEKYCFSCGYVIEENLLEETSLNRKDDSLNFNSRTYDINTERYSKGTHITEDYSRLGRTLRRMNQRSTSTSDRTLYKGVTTCNMLASELNASIQLREQISYNYKNLIKKQLFRGQTVDTRAAAIVYYTYRENGISISINDIIKYNGAKSNRVSKLARKIASAFGKPYLLSQINISEEIEKYSSKLCLNRTLIQDIYSIGIPIYNRAKELCIATNKGFIGAMIYAIQLISNSSKRSQKEISEAANTTEVTLRNNFRVILKMLGYTKEEWMQTTIDNVQHQVKHMIGEEK